jgi:hypothetical protein
LESRQLLTAGPWGATPLDTGEFLLGTVSVTPVFFSSTGQTDPDTQNWSLQPDSQGLTEIDRVMAELTAGLDWWAETLETLDTVHSLEFQIDRTYVDNPFPTRFEPIDNNGADFTKYVTEFVIDRGYSSATSIEDGVRRFNQDQRLAHGTDWAFTIFVADASDDVDKMFAPGSGHRGAFAFAGGLFMVIPSTRTAEVFAHEMGHIFWAMDEYQFGASWTNHRGYYDTQLTNAADNPAFDAPGVDQEISIMTGFTPLEQAFAQRVSPASTLAMVGWQDSDGNGVFDVADVPLELEATGYFDLQGSTYHFVGTASAVPLINKNSAGPQSDITLNRVREIQYRLDEGAWITAATPNQPVAEFELAVSIDDPFETIQWRAIDTVSTVTSPVYAGTRLMPAMVPAAINGVAFVDSNGNGERDGVEPLLKHTTVVIRNPDGSPLFGGDVDAQEYPDGFLPNDLPGATIGVSGDKLDPNAGVFVSADAGDRRVLFRYDPFLNRWSEAWSADAVLGASFDQPVGQVTLDVVGLRQGGFGRLEAYDADGNLIDRATTQALAVGGCETIIVTDPQARIASVRALGHAGTIVGFSRLSFGIPTTVITDDSGSFRVRNLADGAYRIDVIPERVIHQFDQGSINVQVAGGTSPAVLAVAERVDSIRHNAARPEDVTGTDGVTSRDALVVINDLGRNSQRILQPGETGPFQVDVNNDGMVSALDALLVINYLGRQNIVPLAAQHDSGDPSRVSDRASLVPSEPSRVSGRAGLDAVGLTAHGSPGRLDVPTESTRRPRATTGMLNYAGSTGSVESAGGQRTDSEGWTVDPDVKLPSELKEPFLGLEV